MTREEQGKAPMRVSGDGHCGGLKRALAVLAILLGITWIALFIAVRTEGGKAFIVEQASKRLGAAVTIDEASLRFPFGLRLDDVESLDYDQSLRGFRVDTLTIAFRGRPLWSLSLDAPELNMVYAATNGWSPARLAALGELPGKQVDAVSALTEPWRGRFTVRVTDGAIYWLRENGEPMALARGIGFRVSPVRLPGHRAAYHRLAVSTALEPSGQRIESGSVEWLVLEGAPFVELTRSGSVPPAQDDGFWGVSNAISSVD